VSGIFGDTETKTEKTKLGSFDKTITERFNVGDTMELDKSCEGVLGIDANAAIRDIVCGENKVSVKGIIAVNILGVKSTENGTAAYNAFDTIDWTKTFTVSGVSNNDIAIGDIAIANKNIKIEAGAMLNVDIELAFNGITYTNTDITNVVDALSFTKDISFDFTDIEQAEPYPQINSYLDIENNINLTDGTPYISRVLSVDGAKVGSLNILPLDNKISVEGILSAAVLWETENGEVSNYDMELPISFSVRADGIDTDKNVTAVVTPIILNVKARRGVELLIDARLSATVMASRSTDARVVTDIVMGADKIADDAAVHIHIVGENETLWDIAKRTNIPSAELIANNPNLANGCIVGDKVVVYHHKSIAF
jgi:LysM repeat protein